MAGYPDPAVIALHSKMFAHRIAVPAACRRAHIDRKTWSRWSRGDSPSLSKLRQLEATVERMIAEQTLAGGASVAPQPAAEA